MRLEEGGAYSFHWILESAFTSCCHLPLYIDGSSGSGNILWTQQLATVDTFCLLFASQPPQSSSETSITNDQCPLLRGPMFFPRSEITEIDKQCPSLENQSCTSQGLHISLSKTLGSGIFFHPISCNCFPGVTLCGYVVTTFFFLILLTNPVLKMVMASVLRLESNRYVLFTI